MNSGKFNDNDIETRRDVVGTLGVSWARHFDIDIETRRDVVGTLGVS